MYFWMNLINNNLIFKCANYEYKNSLKLLNYFKKSFFEKF